MQTAFITGGSGFLGRNLIRQLRARNVTVRALARSTAAQETVRKLGAAPIAGALRDLDALRAGMSGADVVFHAAAVADEWGDPAYFHRVNVLGTQNVLDAARAAGAGRVVHVSTEAVLAGGRAIVNADETVPRARRPVGLYAASKGAAEARVLAAAAAGLPAVIVRPRLIWGSDDTTLLPRFMHLVKSGQFAWINHGRHLTSTTHVDNACRGLLAAAERGKDGEIYFVTDGKAQETRLFITKLLGTQGVRPGGRSIPYGTAMAIASVGEWVWRAFRLGGAPPLTRLAVNLFGVEVTLDDSKARRELGYETVVSVDEGLRRMGE